jgi:hypothetical protein
VIVRNTLRTHRIALNDIEAAHGSFRGVEIRPTRARGVRAEAAPYSLRAYLHHARGRSGEIADAITAAVRASTDPPPLRTAQQPGPPVEPHRSPRTPSA